MTNPQRVSDAKGEWCEVYNATFETLYLNGLEVETDSDDGPVPVLGWRVITWGA